MLTPMPRPRLPHLEHYRTRHGKWKWYFRVDKGPRVRLPDDYGTPEFKAAYRAALAGEAPAKITEGRTLAWLIEEYLASPDWKMTAKESFGTWFRQACDAAGVPGSCHGLRKIAAIRCAENGATEAEMNAMFGWSDRSRESAVYIRKASREKLGVAASERMIPAEVVKLHKENGDE